MKKILVAATLAVLMSATSAFAADDLYSGGKAVVKGTGKVVEHVSVDTYKVASTVVKDAYGVGKYIVVGAVKGVSHAASQIKHAIKK